MIIYIKNLQIWWNFIIVRYISGACFDEKNIISRKTKVPIITRNRIWHISIIKYTVKKKLQLYLHGRQLIACNY